jgi:Ca2+-dependent lipid-binding protein
MAFLKGTKLNSILFGKCPVCHNESMYKQSNPYKLSQTLHMHERCSHCNTKYKIEPSFFYGAMYVSYPVGILFSAVSFAITYFFIGATLVNTFLAIVGTMVVFLPVIMRLSRNIWINFFMKYDKTKDQLADI